MLKVCAQWQQFQKLWLFKLFLTTLFMHCKALPSCLLWINSLLYLQSGGANCASSIISSLGAMADPQLLHTGMARLSCCCWGSFHQVRICPITLLMTLFWNSHACYCQYSHWVAIVSKGCCFNKYILNIFILLWKFYCVVKCKTTS